MSEFGRKIERRFHNLLSRDLKGGFEKDSPEVFSQQYLNQIGVRPVFESQGDADFADNREKLRREGQGGLIISNHPTCSRADTFSILLASGRKDVSLVIKPGGDMRLKDFFPRDFFIQVSNEWSAQEITTALNTVVDKIHAGGLVIFYPSGGSENSGRFRFYEGFNYILSKLSPNTNVFSFHFNTDDAEKIKSKTQSSKIKRAVSMISGKPLLPIQDLRINLKSKPVSDWLGVVKRNDLMKVDPQVFCEHYTAQFGLLPFNLSKVK